jgi:hypothetical protein
VTPDGGALKAFKALLPIVIMVIAIYFQFMA